MVQIKLFQEKTPDLEVFEKQVNEFLQQHSQEIKVVDKIGRGTRLNSSHTDSSRMPSSA